MRDSQDLRQLQFPWSPRYTITASCAAELLCVSINTVCRMIEDGSLTAERDNERAKRGRWRVRFDEIEDLAQRKQGRMSMENAADLLGVSRDTIHQMIETGELKGCKLRHRKKSPWMIDGESLLAHVERVRVSLQKIQDGGKE